MILERAQFLKSSELSDINHFSVLGKLINFTESQICQLQNKNNTYLIELFMRII